MSWYDRCLKHCKESKEQLVNAEVNYEYKDPHGKTTTHYKCKKCGKEWRIN
jgi:DNA-directed RNA polymerase subunit M/transcription elongation factor TFIIS